MKRLVPTRHRVSATLRWGLASLCIVTAAACGSGAGSATADGPIKIMAIGTLDSPSQAYPQLKTAVQAEVDAINKAGGVDGRKLEASFCNDKFDPNEAAACAQRAVQDKVVAVVGVMSPNSAQIGAVLKAANIPVIGPAGGDATAEATSAPFYPLDGGSAAFVLGLGRLAVERGGPNVVVVSADVAASRAGAKIASQAVVAAGGKATEVVTPLQAIDFDSMAASVLDKHPDGVAMVGTADTAARIITALRHAGFKGAITAPTAFVDAATVKALGPLANGLLFCSRGLLPSDKGNPTIDEFDAEMAAADPNAPLDDIGLNGWMAVRTFAKVIKGKRIATGSDVIKALQSIKKPIDQGGVYPDYPGLLDPPPHKDYPRISVFKTLPRIIKDGKMVVDGKFFDPLR